MLKYGPGGWETAAQKGMEQACRAARLPKGNTMKRQPNSLSPLPSPRSAGGFTLVEMLVVITIIGILAGLITAAAIRARTFAKNSVIVVELSQLDTACKAYKEKFGEYPPDFAGINDSDTGIQQAARAAVTRHIAMAFPHYTGAWTTDIPTVTGIALTQWTPQKALVFWLGGIPDASGNLSGFAADATNPFQTPANCASRIRPFFEFDRMRLNSYSYWPQGAVGDRSSGALVYFRAENGLYSYVNSSNNVVSKSCLDSGAATPQPTVYPAVDTRLSNAWINKPTFQIFSSGLNVKYGTLTGGTTLLFPSGGNYGSDTYDDITNFSNGTLEAAMP
jgi:prepilin-type N-terminal cleavage/methylation domain-containing protein